MSKKVIDTIPENISKFILKTPRETSPGSQEYISEIWYLDEDKLYQAIVRPPRLRIKYGAKRPEKGKTYGYCVNLHNYDIDPEVRKFHEFMLAYDRHIVSQYREHKDGWGLQGVKSKYWTAMRRKDKTSDPYLTVKMLQDGDGTVLTSIHNADREKLGVDDVVYGNYVDQYIGPTFVLYNSTGIYPIWNAHQLVINRVEKVFLEDCLLDTIAPPPTFRPAFHHGHTLSLPPPSCPPPPPSSGPSGPSGPSGTSGPAFGLVRESDLQDAIKNLKRTTGAPKPPQGSMNLIKAEDLLKQREAIEKRAHDRIMLESIKDVPVETGTLPAKKKIFLIKK